MKKQIISLLIIFALSLFVQHSYAQNRNRHHKKNTDSEIGCPLIDSIIEFSKTKLGCAYVSGGTGPRGFDCSGFTYYVFSQFNIQLGRSSRDQFLMGEKIEKADIRPGDLVFWYRGKGYIGHVGIVTEVDSAHNFKFIHSATHGKGVRYDYSNGKWYASTYAGARRIIDCDRDGHAFMIEGSKKTELNNITTPTVANEPPLSSSDSVKTSTIAQPAPTNVQVQPKYVYHKIKKGETLSTIAKKHHVTVNQLKKWNHLRSDMIHEGSRLKIMKAQKVVPPAPAPKATDQPVTVPKDTTKTPVVQTSTVQQNTLPTVPKAETPPVQAPQPKLIYHKIKQGETLSSIARKYHVSVNQLKKWNHLKSDFIRADAKLKIYKK